MSREGTQYKEHLSNLQENCPLKKADQINTTVSVVDAKGRACYSKLDVPRLLVMAKI